MKKLYQQDVCINTEAKAGVCQPQTEFKDKQTVSVDVHAGFGERKVIDPNYLLTLHLMVQLLVRTKHAHS